MPRKIRKIHVPVMLQEVVKEYLKAESRVLLKMSYIANTIRTPIAVDATLGDGGHSAALFSHISSKFTRFDQKFRLYSFDWDTRSIEFCQLNYVLKISGIYECSNTCADIKFEERDAVLYPYKEWYIVHANYAWIDKFFDAIGRHEKPKPFFILADLGVSTRQLKTRPGFSFKKKTRLDLRMSDRFLTPKGYDLLNAMSIREIRDIFVCTIGLNKNIANYLAKNIVIERRKKSFGDRDDLRRLEYIVAKVFRRFPTFLSSKKHLHPMTLFLMALRIAVNSEYSNLIHFLNRAYSLLDRGGSLVIITFHSGEVDIVRQFIETQSLDHYVLHPSSGEVLSNPNSRSAKMYVIHKW